MIRLGLRLALSGGREAVVRLAIIAAAVAIGVGLLLATLAGVNAVNDQNARYAWLNTGFVKNPANTGPAAADPAVWLARGDYFHGANLFRIDVAATGPDSPVPPGIPRLPGPGEYYVSPELGRLIDSTPAGQLGDRFAGHRIGTIAAIGLPSPKSLLAVVGHRPDELAGAPYEKKITRIETRNPSDCNGCLVGTSSDGIDLILAVVAAALLFPLLMFIGTATRLSAARREQRFAAMRLVGATPRQIAVIATVESAVAAVVGTVVGFGLYFALHAALAKIPFTGEPFYPADLRLTLLDALPVALGVPIGAAVAARIALRRVQISPLGVTRRVTPKSPRAWRLAPMLAGVAVLLVCVARPPGSTNAQIQAYLSGIFLIMIGLVVAGPWLTRTGARLLARRASRPATLIAGRRLADNPQAGFRAVSGLMLALFVTSVATGVISTIVGQRGIPLHDSAISGGLNLTFWPDGVPTAQAAVPQLSTVPGVRGVLVVHRNPRFTDAAPGNEMPGVVLCSDLARNPEFGRCATGAQVAGVFLDVIGPIEADGTSSEKVWTAAPITAAVAAAQPMLSLVVNTDASQAALERSRTLIEAAFPMRDIPSTDGEWRADNTKTLSKWQQLANVVILTSLPIAGCSLAVSVAGGLSERKRPFSMLRLTGVRLHMLQRVITLESAMPLIVVSVLAIGMGFLTANLFLRAQLGYTVQPPGPAYYVLVVVGLAASLGIIASTLPLLRRITGLETARNE